MQLNNIENFRDLLNSLKVGLDAGTITPHQAALLIEEHSGYQDLLAWKLKDFSSGGNDSAEIPKDKNEKANGFNLFRQS